MQYSEALFLEFGHSQSEAFICMRIRSIPWIKYVNAQTLKVSDIAGDNGQIVFQGCCRNESIRHFARPAITPDACSDSSMPFSYIAELGGFIERCPGLLERLLEGIDVLTGFADQLPDFRF
jgi:hypothetical protein